MTDPFLKTNRALILAVYPELRKHFNMLDSSINPCKNCKKRYNKAILQYMKDNRRTGTKASDRLMEMLFTGERNVSRQRVSEKKRKR